MSRSALNSLIIVVAAVLMMAAAGGLSPPPISVDKPTCVVILERTDDSPIVPLLPSIRATLLGLQKEERIQYRILDDDLTEEQVAAEEQWARDAYHLPRTSSPWVVTASRRGGASQPLTATSIEDFNAILSEVIE